MNNNNEQLISLSETINQQHDLLKDIKNKNDEIQFTLEEMAQIKELNIVIIRQPMNNP